MNALPTLTLPQPLEPAQRITLRRADGHCHQATAYGLTQVLEPVAIQIAHTPRFPGFIFAATGALILSSAWFHMFLTSSTTGFAEWFAIGTGFFMLGIVRKVWVRGEL